MVNESNLDGFLIGLDWLSVIYLCINASFQNNLLTCQVPKQNKIAKVIIENIDGQSIGLKKIFIGCIYAANYLINMKYLSTTPPIYTNK
jgi:hypothetical protein